MHVRERVREGERRVENRKALFVLQHVHAVRRRVGQDGATEYASRKKSSAGPAADRGVRHLSRGGEGAVSLCEPCYGEVMRCPVRRCRERTRVLAAPA